MLKTLLKMLLKTLLEKNFAENKPCSFSQYIVQFLTINRAVSHIKIELSIYYIIYVLYMQINVIYYFFEKRAEKNNGSGKGRAEGNYTDGTE